MSRDSIGVDAILGLDQLEDRKGADAAGGLRRPVFPFAGLRENDEEWEVFVFLSNGPRQAAHDLTSAVGAAPPRSVQVQDRRYGLLAGVVRRNEHHILDLRTVRLKKDLVDEACAGAMC